MDKPEPQGLTTRAPNINPQPVTGCADRIPMVDRNGTRLKVGDRIRYQYCSGRYGQTRIAESLVERAHYPYGDISGATFHLDFKANVLRGKHTHHDYEHGHETWVEIIA